MAENFKVMKLVDSIYKNEIGDVEDEAIYCEIHYQRDRSSFAGIALKVTNEKNVIAVRQCGEKIIADVNKYEKLYLGCDQDYLDSIKNIFDFDKKNYGLEVIFLVYSNIQSSQIIFEELMKNIDTNIETIKNYFMNW